MATRAFGRHAVIALLTLGSLAPSVLPAPAVISQSLDLKPPVLFFVPVGVHSLALMRDNVAALKRSYPPLEFFFAHYDGPKGRAAFAKEAWYVDAGLAREGHSCAYAGFKPTFIFKELVERQQLRRDPWLQRFKYVWVSDDNIDFTHTDAAALVANFARSGAAVGQPAVENSYWRHLTWRHEGAATDCGFRYVPFVEVMTPIFAAEALEVVYGRLFRASEGATQDLGLDEVWCAYLGAYLYGGGSSGGGGGNDGSGYGGNGGGGKGKLAGPPLLGRGPDGRVVDRGPDGRAACVVVDAAVAVKLQHEGHAYGVKEAQSDRHRAHALFGPFVFTAKDKDLTRGACVRRCERKPGGGGRGAAGGAKPGLPFTNRPPRTEAQQQQSKHPAPAVPNKIDEHEAKTLPRTPRSSSSSAAVAKVGARVDEKELGSNGEATAPVRRLKSCKWDNFHHKVNCDDGASSDGSSELNGPEASPSVGGGSNSGGHGSGGGERGGPEPQWKHDSLQRHREHLALSASAAVASSHHLGPAGGWRPELLTQDAKHRFAFANSSDPRLNGGWCVP